MKAILHRKDAPFQTTENGADAGEVLMTLIPMAELSGINPFDYLIEPFHRPRDVAESVDAWLPWNDRQTVPFRQPVATGCASIRPER